MNPTSISRLALDTSGKSVDNRIVDEPHTLKPYRFRAVAPNLGAFFSEDFTITDAVTLRTLVVGIDYRFLVPYQSLSQLYGKDIVGAAIVINPDVSASVLVTYQALGSDYVHNLPALVDLLSTDNLSAVSSSFLDIQNRPAEFMPTPHIQDLGDGVGFEYLVYALETLGRVIMSSDDKVLAAMFDRIDIKLQEIAKKAIYRQDTELSHLLNAFRKDFTKQSLGLGFTPNFPEASENEGAWAARAEFNMGGDINNRLVTLRSLVSFREELMSRVVSSEKTSLGKSHGVYLSPSMAGLESMGNGARYLLDSLDAAMLSGIAFDRQIYPDLSTPTTRWALHKVINNVSDRGGVFQAINMTTGQSFTGILGRTAGQPQITWRRQMTEGDITDVLEQLTKHLKNKDNPHGLTKASVLLDQVENLPVADRMTILGRKPKREYVTHDGLELFFAAIVANDWTIDDSEDTTEEQKKKARNAYTTLFATAGICGDGDGVDENGMTINITPRATNPPVPPRGQVSGWYCEGTSRVTKVTDGLGGYYLENTLNDSDCGYINEVANYEIRDQDGEIIGLAFSAAGRVDPAATVALQDAAGVTLCFIYPTTATGRQVSVRNSGGSVLGYAIDPL